MTQTRSFRPRLGGSAGKSSGGPPSHLLLMELKHRILAALGKLADRDTQQIAVDDLEKIVECLSPEGISMCLSCIYDTDLQQKSVVKKECVKLFGTLASLHGDLLVPHLPKIVASIVRRFKDPDTSVRDACVDAMGILAASVLTSGGTRGQESAGQAASALELATFVKPLFDALSEQNKSVQIGAAMCLARVIESAKDHPLGGMARLCPRICKFLTSPNFLAKAALLPVIGSLSQVGAVNQQVLAILFSCVHEALESNDWATRKAAAETLTRMASNLGPALASFKSPTLLVLESCRFDKVKPVRDCVQDATQIWRNLPGLEGELSVTPAKSDTAANGSPDLSSSIWSLNLQTPSPTLSETMPFPRPSAAPSACELTEDTKLVADKVPSILKKRSLGLTDKKPNPDFFQKLETRGSDDWQIEVAVPRSCPPSMSRARDGQPQGVNAKVDLNEVLPAKDSIYEKRENELIHSSPMKDDEKYNQGGMQLAPVKNLREPDNILKTLDGNSALSGHGRKNSNARQIDARPCLDTIFQERDADNHPWDAVDHILGSSSNGSHKEGQNVNGRANLLLLFQRQISQLEYQQSQLMEMLQEFMGNSKNSMLALEARVSSLERVVEDIAQDLEVPSGCLVGYEGVGDPSYSKYLVCPEYMDPKVTEGMDSPASFSEKPPASEAMNSEAKNGRGSAWIPSEVSPKEWNGHAFGAGTPSAQLMEVQAGCQRSNIGTSGDFFGFSREDSGEEHMATRRAWDRESGHIRLGEGPSARSVWQASKDEATLAAIRVAGEDGGALEAEAPSAETSRQITQESASTTVPHKNGGQGKGPYWRLWSHAVECVHAGDMDSAYVEVLRSGDELMLVRLMNKTGPVLGQLCASTANEMLHTVGQLLRQQSFFDFSLPWIQQVADLIVEVGAECLDLSTDVKRELLLSLQEAGSMDLPEDWLGNSIGQLFSLLRQAWPVE